MSNIRHDPPFIIKIKEKRCAFQLKSHSFNFPHHKRPHPVLSSILQHSIIMKPMSGYCIKLCPQLFFRVFSPACLPKWIMLAGSFHTGVLSINAKLPPRCSVEREKLPLYNGKNRKFKTKKKNEQNNTLVTILLLCRRPHWILSSFGKDEFICWLKMCRHGHLLAISYIVQWYLKWL